MDELASNSAITIRKSDFDLRLFVSVVVLSIMVFSRDLGYIGFSPIHFVLAVTVISIALPCSSLKAFYFFYFPFGTSIHGVALIPILIALISKSKKYNSYQLFFPVIILSFELMHLLSYDFGVDFNKYVIYVLNITMFFFILYDDNINDYDLKNEMRFYILGVAVASVIIMIHSYKFYGFQDILLQNVRVGADLDDYEADDEMVTLLNPNQLAFYSITAFSLLLFVKDVFCNKLLKFVLIIIIIISGILTGSRTWIILMAVVLMLYFGLSEIKGKLSFALVLIALLFVTSRYGDFGEMIYSRYEHRFEEENFSTGGHRTVIFKDYNQWLRNNPGRIIYGAGALYYNNIAHLQFSTHNSSQQIIVCYGIIGLLIFASCFIVYHKRYAIRYKHKLGYYVPFIICFIFSQTGQFLSPACMMFPFVATALPLKLTTNNR